MITLFADEALLPAGWARDVAVDIGSDGRIAAVRPDEAPSQTQGGTAAPERLPILLPAPVNLHSHAFQRAMAGMTERRGPNGRDTFWTWRALMFRFLEALTPEDVEAIAALVQVEMAEAGYGASVEFHYLHHQPDGTPYAALGEMCERIAAAAATSGLGLVLLPVHYARGGCDGRPLTAGQIRFGNDLDRFARLMDAASVALAKLPADAGLGLAPHSLRAVAPEDLTQLPELFRGPIHMHLAEQVGEVAEVQAATGARPVEWALANLPLDPRWCLIHATQMEAHETVALANTGAVAGLCPITESSLGDGTFDAVRFTEAGGRFGVGSDSNIRIALSEELRTLEYSQRLRDRGRAMLATAERSTGRALFEGVLAAGAQAAQRDCGSIAAGNWADLLSLDGEALDLAGRKGDAILDAWIFAGDDRMVRNVWSAGRRLVREGRHVNRETVARAYRATLSNLLARL